MIPCHYCGGTPELRHYKAELGHFAAESYMVVCKNCGARTWNSYDPEVVKLRWDREYVMELVKEEKKKVRYIEIDGAKVKVRSCTDCPCYTDVDYEGNGPWCKHPIGSANVKGDFRIGIGCPLREEEVDE